MPVAQVLRFENRKTLPDALAAHNRGDKDARPVEAAGRDMYGGRAAIDLGSEPEKARLLIAEAMMIKRRGRKGDQVTEFLIAGPPPFESPDAWSVEKLDAFTHESADWLRAILPDGVPLHTVSYHVDERSPHIQGCFPNVTFDADTDKPRLSWDRMLSSMTATAVERLAAAGEPAPATFTDRERLSILQDSFQAEVGRRYGLDRGEIGSTQQHELPDRARGLKERLSDSERISLETAERAAVEAAARAAQLAAEQRRAAALADAKTAAEKRAEAAEKRAAEQAKLRAGAEKQAAAEAAGRTAAEKRAEAAEKRAAEHAALQAHAEKQAAAEAVRRTVAETRAGLAKRHADKSDEQRARSERREQSRQRREAKTAQLQTRRQRSPVTRSPQATSTQADTPARSRSRELPTIPGPSPARRTGPSREPGRGR